MRILKYAVMQKSVTSSGRGSKRQLASSIPGNQADATIQIGHSRRRQVRPMATVVITIVAANRIVPRMPPASWASSRTI